ncbi:MAG: molybdopterin-synthase adenylyltransferase MoeB [Bacteroidota bacterium]
MMIEVNSFLDKLRTQVKEIGVLDAFARHAQGGYLIDIREKDEFNSGSPVGAMRIPKGLLEMQIPERIPENNQDIFLICASGRRSIVAAFCLQQMGYQKVYSVKGGFKDWKTQALPFEIPKALGHDDFERYKRHLLIPEMGEEGQLKLLNSRVLVVGAGGIGSPVAWYLAAAGVGHLGIIDDDIVDRSNLQRQILHTEDSVGTPKVHSAKERLKALNPSIEVITYNERLTIDNVEAILGGFDLVLDGTDNFTTRYLINDACVKLGIPNVHGSVFRFEGQVSTFWPAMEADNTPCYRCVYPEPPPPELAPSCAEAGVLGVLPGMVGLICATEAIKILVGFGELMVGKLLCFNAADWTFDIYEVDQKSDCPYCSCDEKDKYPNYVNYAQYCAI